MILLATTLLSFSAFAQPPYQWPLEANFGISSTFGEFRGDHFHAGIDLSTNGETGLPVFAIDDGVIYRLKVDKRGYGRALYIQHEDGLQSVYAHLERYSRTLGIEQIYQMHVESQERRYPGDIFLDSPIAVKRGDVVAYSGESGAGAPHLHLELRRNENVIINPLKNGFVDPLDRAAPIFQACFLYPLTPESAVNGDLETRGIAFKRSDTGYIAVETPVVRGDFMLAVSAYDPTIRAYRRAPYSISYSIDDRPIYSLEFDRFVFGEQYALGLFYDRGKPGSPYYEYPIMLRKMINPPLPFIKNAVPISVGKLAPGLHRLRVEAKDVNLNTSVANMDFIVNDPPVLEFRSIGADQNNLLITAAVRDANWKSGDLQSLAAELQYSDDGGKTFEALPMTVMDPKSREFASFEFRLPFATINEETNRGLLLRGRAFDGAEYSPYATVGISTHSDPKMDQPKEIPAGVLNFKTYPNAVRITFTSDSVTKQPLFLQVGEPPKRYRMQSRDLNVHDIVLPLPAVSGTFRAQLSSTQQIEIPVTLFEAEQANVFEGDNFRLDLPANSLFWNSFVWPQSIAPDRGKWLPFIGPMLQLTPRGLPLRQPATLGFTIPASFSQPEKLGVYLWNRRERTWQYKPSVWNERINRVEAQIQYFDLYALIYDNAAPSISSIFPKRNSRTRNRTPKLAAAIRDRGVGVHDERIFFTVDRFTYKAEYDPDSNLATFQIEKPLTKGTHRCKIVAYDSVGNKSESATIAFRVR